MPRSFIINVGESKVRSHWTSSYQYIINSMLWQANMPVMWIMNSPNNWLVQFFWSMLSNARILDYMQILQWCRATKGQQVICINLKILQHTLPHGTLSLIISTLIVNVVQLKYLIHPIEERKSQQPDQSKWEDLQGSSFDHTSMISSRICPRINVMILLNGKITIRMSVKSRNTTK